MTARRLALPLLLAALLSGCRLKPTHVIIIELPAVSPLGIEDDAEIFVEDFKQSAPVPDLNLGRDVADYLARELRAVFRGKVSHRPASADGPPAARDREAAASGAPPSGRVFLLSGEVQLLQESQKALREAALPKDGPFHLEGRGLVERKKFTLEIVSRLIDEARGEAIFEKAITATRAYDNAQTYPEYALRDLLPLVKARLFPELLGRPALARRILLVRPPERPSGPL